jgi:5'-3' exonuclease
MGIPYYFSFIIKNYLAKKKGHDNQNNQIIRSFDRSNPIHHLFMDCNSIIYDAFHHIMSKEVFSEDTLINNVCDKIREYMEHVRPSGVVFIAFDGVAPMAKMEQQRTRRYKSAYFPKEDGSSAAVGEWNTANITPGTAFMNKLMSEVKQRMSVVEKSYKQVIVSGSDKVGEGEHKLFQFIRDYAGDFRDSNIGIYGLDSDLIMLALVHIQLVKNIYILREPPVFMQNLEEMRSDTTRCQDHLWMLDISMLTKIIYNHIREGVCRECGLATLNGDIFAVVHDYVFLCFFLGNDFLPHFPSLNIRTHGIQVLLDTYRIHILKRGYHMVHVPSKRIIWKSVNKLISVFASMEHELLIQEHEYRNGMSKRIGARIKEEEIMQNIPILYRGVETYICPEERGWQERYYNALFGSDTDDDEEHIKEICFNYREGLEWVFKYYVSDCQDWQWKYNYHYPPLFSDLKWSTGRMIHDVFVGPAIERYNPCDPIQQLRYVLPKSQLGLIPQEDAETAIVRSNKNTYTERAKSVFAYCRYLWECHIEM